MSEIKFRLAKPSDAKQIAYVHYHIRDKYDQGFFAQVNYAFLKQYYKVVLNDPCEVVVCAEDENQKIVGFSSSSLDSERQFKMMRKKKFSFVFPLLTSALAKPKLIKSALDRFKSTKGDSANEYVTSKGARVEYWGWLPGRDDSDLSIVMQDILFYTMKMLGAEKLYFEVDKVNKRIFKFHKINGAEEVKTFVMPDGRERVELVYDMNIYKFKI
jgi:hypothetical protein